MKTKVFSILPIFLSICFFANSQKYPIQTIFKGDSVVILEVKQAMGINDLIRSQTLHIKDKDFKINKNLWKIRNLNDSLKNLNWILNVTKADLNRKLWKTQDSLRNIRIDLLTANNNISYYQNEMRRIEKLEWIEKKNRIQMKIGLAGVIITWIIIAVSSIK